MKYEDIKNYAARCDSHPDHQTGIITHQMIMDRLHDEIEELRDYIEAKSKPLTDEEIEAEFHRKCWVTVQFADGDYGIALDRVTVKDFARAIERAHNIGGEE